ncbi:MAG: O-antigen ligase family protein [Caulobacter sp.]|nr:O-antigen ligase family protein [Caulobacter sp.]
MSERAAVIGLLALVFLAVLAFGASDVAVAAAFSTIYAATLGVLLATCGWARRDLVRLPGLKLQAILLGVLLLAVAWPLTPWGPGGAHPAWTYLPGRAGSLSVDRSALLLNLLQLLGLACLFVAARVVGVSEQRARLLLRLAVLAIGAYAVVGFVDQVTVRRSSRLAATLLSPNTAATVLGAGLLLAVAAAGNRLRRFPGLSALRRGDVEAVAALAAAAVLATALMLTASRAGAVAALAGLGLFLVWEAFAQKQRLKATTGLLVTAVLLLVGALVLRSAGGLATRLEVADQDVAARATIFAAHWQAFLAAPWFGYGLGSFATVNQLVTTTDTLPALYNVRATHNLYLQWLEEGGVVGSLAMLALFMAVVIPVARGGLRAGTTGAWARAVICAAVVFLLHGAADFALQVPAVQALAVLMLGVVGSMVAGRSPAAEPLRDWRFLGAAGLSGAATLAGLLAAVPLLAAKLGGDLSVLPTAPADALASAIEQGLAQPNVQAADPRTLARLAALSDRELALRPANGAAWLRRAAVEAARGDQVASNTALERSFAVAPLQASLFRRRTLFAYDRWSQLSQSARDQEIYHLKGEWLRWPHAKPLVALANEVTNPAGRVGLALQVTVLKLRYPASRVEAKP